MREPATIYSELRLVVATRGAAAERDAVPLIGSADELHGERSLKSVR